MLRGGRGRQGPTTQTLFQPLTGHTFPFPPPSPSPSCSLQQQLQHFQESRVESHHLPAQDLIPGSVAALTPPSPSFARITSTLWNARPGVSESVLAHRLVGSRSGQASVGRRFSLPHTPPEPPDIHYSTSTTPQPFTDSTLPLYIDHPHRSLPPAPLYCWSFVLTLSAFVFSADSSLSSSSLASFSPSPSTK